MALPTVADLKAHANIPAASTTDDDELQEFLDAAVEIVEGMVGPLTEGPVTEVHRAVNTDTLVLRRQPASAVTAVSSRYGTSDLTALTLGDYELDADAGLLRAYSGARFYGTYVIEYTAGGITASDRLAVLIIAAHLLETQRVPMQSDAPAGFGDTVGGAPVGVGYAIPNRALELLKPRMGVTIG